MDWKQPLSTIEIGTGICLQEGKDVAILSIGTIAKNVSQAIAKLPDVAHFDLRFVKPLDERLLHSIFSTFSKILTVEDGVIKGGFGSAILEFASQNNYLNKIEVLGIQDSFIEHGKVGELQVQNGIDVESIRKKAYEFNNFKLF